MSGSEIWVWKWEITNWLGIELGLVQMAPKLGLVYGLRAVSCALAPLTDMFLKV